MEAEKNGGGVVWGGDTLASGGGGRVSILAEGQTLWYSRYICALDFQHFQKPQINIKKCSFCIFSVSDQTVSWFNV